MPKLAFAFATAALLICSPVRALDLMTNPDRCQIARLGAVVRPTSSRVLCWHQDVKLLTGVSILTKLIRNRTATFVDGTGTLDFSVAALTGYRLDSLVRYWEGDHVYLAVVLARRDPAPPDPITQVYEISPNHFFAY